MRNTVEEKMSKRGCRRLLCWPHAKFPCCPGPRPTVMTQWTPPAVPRRQQPIRSSEPTDGSRWHHAASKTENADLFSGVWNPAFVKQPPPPPVLQPGGVYSEQGPNAESDSQFSALCLLAAAEAICGRAWGLGSSGGCWELTQRVWRVLASSWSEEESLN